MPDPFKIITRCISKRSRIQIKLIKFDEIRFNDLSASLDPTILRIHHLRRVIPDFRIGCLAIIQRLMIHRPI